MTDPLKPLKESIKHVPIMKYALAFVGLAAAASVAFAYFESMKYGIIAMSVVVVFMILIILITNIPKIKYMQVYVSAFLIFILISIFTVSGWFIWTMISDTGGGSKKEVVIDVENALGEPIKEGMVRLKIKGMPEIISEISLGTVSFPIGHLKANEDSATVMMNKEGYEKYIKKVSVNDLLDQIFMIKLSEKGIENVNAVFKMGSHFCADLKTKMAELKIKRSKEQESIFHLKPTYSGNIELVENNLYKYSGGHLIIKVNGLKVSFESKIIDPIEVFYGSPKDHIEKELKSEIKKLTCSFTRGDINKIINTL